MKIRVVKKNENKGCKDHWYNSEIGNVFKVEETYADGSYKINLKKGDFGNISPEYCEVVKSKKERIKELQDLVIKLEEENKTLKEKYSNFLLEKAVDSIVLGKK